MKRIILRGFAAVVATGTVFVQANAQSTQDKAQAYFYAAEKSYQTGNYHPGACKLGALRCYTALPSK